jgi:hypothetical protein
MFRAIRSDGRPIGRMTSYPEVMPPAQTFDDAGHKSAWRKCRRQKRGTSQDLREARFRVADNPSRIVTSGVQRAVQAIITRTDGAYFWNQARSI